jgi:hypothetical protein
MFQRFAPQHFRIGYPIGGQFNKRLAQMDAQFLLGVSVRGTRAYSLTRFPAALPGSFWPGGWSWRGSKRQAITVQSNYSRSCQSASEFCAIFSLTLLKWWHSRQHLRCKPLQVFSLAMELTQVVPVRRGRELLTSTGF